MDAHARYSAAWPLLTCDDPPDREGVLVVAVELDVVAPDAALLSDHERARADRLRDPLLQRRQRAAHQVLRQVLAWWLGGLPHEVPIVSDERGKPAVRDQPVTFSLSHSGGWALIAVAAEGQVGVDVELGERLREVDLLAERLLAPADLAAFRMLPAERKTVAFLTTWVRTEAALKAIGLGLPGGMEHVQISESPLRLHGDFTRLPQLASLHLHDLPEIGGGVAALAQGPHRRVPACRAWPAVRSGRPARPLPC